MRRRSANAAAISAVEALEPRRLLSIDGLGLGFPSVAGDSDDDPYEENDTRDTASDPLNNGGDWAERALSTINGRATVSRAGDDWYRLEIAPGGGRLIVDLTFIDATGDVDIALFDSQGRFLNSETGVVDNEHMETQLAQGGTYFLRVYLFSGNPNSYDLVYRLEAPEPGQIQGRVWDDVDADGIFDSTESPLAGWQVYLDQNNDALLTPGEPVRVSAANGSYVFADVAPGTYTVREVLQSGYEQTFPLATTPPGSEYQIVVRFTDTTLTASQQAIFSQAAFRWSQVITGDVPDVFVQGIGLVDDLVIDASAPDIDGPGGILGQAGPRTVRQGSFLPSSGVMQFDSADLAALEAQGQLLDVILHEMGHVLGIGTIWDSLNLLTGAGGPDPRFTGAQATAAYNAIFNNTETSVPVENTGGPGTADSHIRESVFGNELMTGFLNSGVANPLSAITVGSLADLGYVVNPAAADPYTPPAAGLRTAAGRSLNMGRFVTLDGPVTFATPAPAAARAGTAQFAVPQNGFWSVSVGAGEVVRNVDFGNRLIDAGDEDAYEENDTRETAADPLGNGGRWAGRGLSTINGRGVANDPDYYQVRIDQEGRFTADLSFRHAGGDIDLQLIDAAGRRVAIADSTTDNEHIEADVQPGLYTLNAYPFSGTRNAYDLVWNLTPGPLPARVSVAVSPAAVVEDSGDALNFTFTRTGSLDAPLNVNFLVGGTAGFGSDYTPIGAAAFDPRLGRVTFEAGRSTAVVRIDPTADDLVEADETVVLTVASGDGYLPLQGAQTTTGVIRNDDATRLSVADARVVEGGQGATRQLEFVVTLSGPSSTPVSVRYVTRNGTAMADGAGGDYTSASGMLRFNPGVTRQVVRVAVTGDAVVERDETLSLRLFDARSEGQAVALGRSEATGTIVNDDRALVSVGNARVVEGSEGTRFLEFNVVLNRLAETPVAVAYRTVDGTATAASGDYRAVRERVEITAGTRSQTIRVAVLGDRTVERDETVLLDLVAVASGGRAVELGRSRGIGTIVNDDAARVSVGDARVIEGPTGSERRLIFTLSLDRPVDLPFAVAYNTLGLRAEAGSDFTPVQGRIVFAAGATSRTVAVTLRGDDVVELNERMALDVTGIASGSRPVTIGRGRGFGEIINDDAATLSIEPTAVREGPEGVVGRIDFTVTLSRPVDSGVFVRYRTAGGTATSNRDFRATAGRLYFAPGVTSQVISVPVFGDNLVEANESFNVLLSDLVAFDRSVSLGRSRGTGTILNDDGGRSFARSLDAVFAAGIADAVV